MNRVCLKVVDQERESSKHLVDSGKHMVCEKEWMDGEPRNLIGDFVACSLNTCLPLLCVLF